MELQSCSHALVFESDVISRLSLGESFSLLPIASLSLIELHWAFGTPVLQALRNISRWTLWR